MATDDPDLPEEPPAHQHARRAPRPTSAAVLEAAASLFRAAGDPARLRLLDLLGDGEWCVSELADVTGEGLSTMSQRLRVLRQERLVVRRREGKHVYYALADDHVRDLVREVLEHVSETMIPRKEPER